MGELDKGFKMFLAKDETDDILWSILDLFYC